MGKDFQGYQFFLFVFQLPEVELKDYPEDSRKFELHHPSAPNYPITLVAHKDAIKSTWLNEIREYASDIVALAEHAADDLQLTGEADQTDSVPASRKPSLAKTLVEKRREDQTTAESSDSKKAKIEEIFVAANLDRQASANAASKIVEGK